MVKYDESFKLRVIYSYLNGEGGYGSIAQEYGIPDKCVVRKWINAYKNYGLEGIKRKNKHAKYALKFKMDVVQYYLENRESVREVANRFGLTNQTLVDSWLSIYRKSGIDGLSKPKGRPTLPNKKNNRKFKKEKKLTREQQLERENELLRAELAFIKKLRASGINIPDRLKK